MFVKTVFTHLKKTGVADCGKIIDIFKILIYCSCVRFALIVNGYKSLTESNFGVVFKTKCLPYNIFNVK